MTENSTISKEEKSPMSNDNGDFLIAPKGYDKEFADTFTELPLRWRQYLIAREAAVDKGFGDITGRMDANRWLKEAYDAIADDLRHEGITNPKDWLKSLVELDRKLKNDPRGTIALVAQSYGVDLPALEAQKAEETKAKTLNQVLTEQMVGKEIYDFVNGKDEQGELKHPFYADVVRDMHGLLSSGNAQSLAQAYDMAIWLNQDVRSKLLSQKIQAALKDKATEAEKSQEVAFAPHGKSQPETKKLSLREDLEQRFAALGYTDD